MPRLRLAVLLAIAPIGAALAADGPALDLSGGSARSGTLAGPDFTASVTLETRTIDDAELPVPVFRIVEAGRVVFEEIGTSTGLDDPQGSATILEMDAANDGPEVLFASDSGGVHCCTTAVVADRTADGRWTAVPLGTWEGLGVTTEDLDGDGVEELAQPDNDFFYAFDCFACSVPPLTIRSIRAGVAVDSTREPRFQPAHRRWLADIEAEGGAAGDAAKGYWAGWVAAKALVGEGKEAWARFRRAYEPEPGDEGVLACATDQDPCPDNGFVYMPLPDALRPFLLKRGFVIE